MRRRAADRRDLAAAKASDAVLMGAVGGAVGARPGRRSRATAPGSRAAGSARGHGRVSPTCARPSASTPLADASTLKREVVEGLDLMIVRELTGGVYFGQPRGDRDPARRPEARASTPRSTPPTRSSGSARVAFELARGRRNKVTSCREGQRHGDRRALARGGHRAARPRVRRRDAGAHAGRQRRHAAGQEPAPVRRASSPTTCSATSSPTRRRS